MEPPYNPIFLAVQKLNAALIQHSSTQPVTLVTLDCSDCVGGLPCSQEQLNASSKDLNMSQLQHVATIRSNKSNSQIAIVKYVTYLVTVIRSYGSHRQIEESCWSNMVEDHPPPTN